MGKIKDEQDLLERYYSAERNLIWEYSAQISADLKALNEQVMDYVARGNLNGKFIEEE
jgi:hypothetical protein